MRPIADITKAFGRTLSNNSPHILTAMACTGVISTAVLAVKATPTADSKISAERVYRAERDNPGEEELPYVEISNLDKIKLTWKGYIPAAAVGLSTMACVIGVNSIHTRRSAALMSVYTITDKAFRDYKAEVVETIGEQKERDIRDKVAEKQVLNDPIDNKEVFITGVGEQLCYDSLTGRYFKSDIESIRKAVNTVNAQMIHDVYASQNDFYREVGLDPIPNGDELGWTTASMLDISYTAMMAKDGVPCINLQYRIEPIRGYYHLHG